MRKLTPTLVLLTVVVLTLGCTRPATNKTDLLNRVRTVVESTKARPGETDDQLQLRKAEAAVDVLIERIPAERLPALVRDLVAVGVAVSAWPDDPDDPTLPLRKMEVVIETLMRYVE